MDGLKLLPDSPDRELSGQKILRNDYFSSEEVFKFISGSTIRITEHLRHPVIRAMLAGQLLQMEEKKLVLTGTLSRSTYLSLFYSRFFSLLPSVESVPGPRPILGEALPRGILAKHGILTGPRTQSEVFSEILRFAGSLFISGAGEILETVQDSILGGLFIEQSKNPGIKIMTQRGENGASEEEARKYVHEVINIIKKYNASSGLEVYVRGASYSLFYPGPAREKLVFRQSRQNAVKGAFFCFHIQADS